MSTQRKVLRGTGAKLRLLPFVFRYSLLWFVVIVAAVPVFSVVTYLMFSDILTEDGRRILWSVVLTRTPLIAVAVAALAVFTTQRLAGPFVSLKRAFDAVTAGDLARRIRFRRSDAHLRDLETAFNDMMETLEKRVHGGANRSSSSGSSGLPAAS